MKIFTFVCCLLFVQHSFAQGIEFFKGTWKEVLTESQKVGKPIFVDSYTTWCGPCKNMAANVFTKPQVGKFFNENFVNYKLDMETPEGKAFESTYPVSAYPTLFFIDEKGKVLKKVVGGQQVDGLIAQGQEALKKGDNVEAMNADYAAGKKDFEFMIKYVKALNNQGKPSLKVSNDFLASEPKITEEQIMLFTFEAAVEADSKLFEAVVSKKDSYIKLVGEDKYNAKVMSACRATLDKSIEFDAPELMKEALTVADKALTKEANEFRYSSEALYYKSFNKKEDYLKTSENYAKTVAKDDKKLLTIAQNLCKDFKEDPIVLKKATNFAANAYKLNATFDNLSFYCKLLVDGNNFKEALKLAEQALKMTKKTAIDADIKKYESFIELIKSKKA
jgi:thiol-disulfide isomerase/thioredoxin